MLSGSEWLRAARVGFLRYTRDSNDWAQLTLVLDVLLASGVRLEGLVFFLAELEALSGEAAGLVTFSVVGSGVPRISCIG